ncbi:MAG: acetate/propionate family kinase [Proteobacteria bacterium]|nr:acetate/propionate family kinase [Pseudomonadota bacterium]
MADALLVLNAGSSSLKFSLFAAGSLDVRLRGEIEDVGGAAHFYARDSRDTVLGEKRWGGPLGHAEALGFLLDFLPGTAAYDRLVAVGHRVVHGGREYSGPVRIDAQVLAELDKLIPLAPLHQPHSLAAMRAVATLDAALPQVACFDTAFHRFQPHVAQAFALPASITSLGVQRYGFHGLSYEHVAAVLPELDARAATGRTIVAHLGAGSSLCALSAGRSVATTMGFTALDGVPMGTRCGSLDPGVVLYMLGHLGMSTREVEHVLYYKSGLAGVSGVSEDMRELLASDDLLAQAAIDLYVYRIGREIGSLAAALGGLDALVFTGGIGEHHPAIRAGVCAAAGWLGLELDAPANGAGGPRISSEASRVSAWVIPADEEGIIARHTLRTLRVH